MGSIISVIFTEAVLQFIESRIIEETSLIIVFWKRYVDDVNIDIIPEDKEGKILDFINRIDLNIQFTSETEQNSKLAYLDLEIFGKDNGTSFSVHRKSTHMDRMLDFSSNYPLP